MQKRLFLLLLWIVGFSFAAMSQVTTAGITGKVTANTEDVIGASIKATHLPTGSVYLGVSNDKGRFTLQGLRAGGPYQVQISYIGYETKTFDNVFLKLGEMAPINAELKENTQELGELVVIGQRGLDASKTGAAQSIGENAIRNMPSITHGISDVIRQNAQVNVGAGGSMSFAGVNNRYNSFQIDGAVNNDLFGLTKSGSNGGQAGAQPVSMETIEQIQINVAPFDVRQSGFTGGAINAITKSGTNQFHGSLYGFGYNQSLIGKHYTQMNGEKSKAYDNQTEYNAGITFGGPIIKDKLFFFANYEATKQEYDNNYFLGEGTQSLVPAEDAKEALDYIKNLAKEQGVSFTDEYNKQKNYTKSKKAGLKLDWNINDYNKASLRWSMVNGDQLNATSGIRSLSSSNYAYNFSSKTNTLVAELNSRFTQNLSNEFRATYMRVRDERQPGNPEPMININLGAGSVNLGNEQYSMANSLDQDMYQITDNLTWYKGDHTLTFGTHNEFYKFANLFIPNAYGYYKFNSLDDLKAGKIDRFLFGVADVDITGNPRWKAGFGAGQLGFYVQDKWNVLDNLELTYGVRADIPLFFDEPTENAPFNEYAAQQGWNVKTNQKLSSSPLWSPRLGFRWDIANDRKYILRGGVGIFTGRIPFVWLSNSFSNTGIQTKAYDASASSGATANLDFILDPNKQQQNVSKLQASGSQQLNVFDKDFKFAQNAKFNLGLDANVLGIDWTLEGIYSKTINDIFYQNLAYDVDGTKTLADTRTDSKFDTRPMFKQVTKGTDFSKIYKLSNTDKGYTYSLSIKGEKKFDFGLDVMASYTYSQSKSVNSGTSSQASSNWNYNYTHNNPNEAELTYSAFNVPHSVNASVYYHVGYGKQKEWTTTVGLIYQGRSGAPYSVYYNGDINGDSSNGNDLIFIPTDAQIDQMSFLTGKLSVDEQKAEMKKWIAGDDYMSKHRGQYFDRYAANEPFEHHFDFHFAQKYQFKVGEMVHAVELSFDILNVGNLFNDKWGRTSENFGFGAYYQPVKYVYDSKTKASYYQFDNGKNYQMRQYSDYLSRWRGQIGVRYTF